MKVQLRLKVMTVTTLLLCCSLSFGRDANVDAGSVVKSLLERHIGPKHAEAFSLKVNADVQVGDWHQVQVKHGEVVVEGSSAVAAARGAYQYLYQQGYYYQGWDGSRLALPKQFPDYQGKKVASPFTHRAYLNVVAYGYSTPWWDWERWQQEIDWMALRGINMPVAMEGQEYIWRQLWREFGLSEDEISQHFSGAAFLPWQRMGNIEAHGGPLSNHWIDAKSNLQKKIIKRMHEFDMTPVTPAFAGYVPKVFIKHYPGAKISQMNSWSAGFEGAYWLDPSDPLFSKIAKRFLQLYRNTYGKTKFHMADAFNEVTPPVRENYKKEDLARYGKVLYNSIKSGSPDGVWVMQGWQFGHDKTFWTPDAVQAFLGELPNDDVMVHDIGNDRYPIWRQLKAFHGKSWIYGIVHNYGGADPLFGDFDFYRSQVQELVSSPERNNNTGFGVFPEGIEQNGVIYDYAFDLSWGARNVAWRDWIEQYLRARYGEVSPVMLTAWQQLKQALYRERYWQPRWQYGAGNYLLQKRPSLQITEFSGHPGDAKKLRLALDSYLDESKTYSGNKFFYRDLIDMTRHYVTQKIDGLLMQTIKSYQGGNIGQATAERQQLLSLVTGIEKLLSQQPGQRLDDWVNAAKRWGNTRQQQRALARNAKQQLTIWGGSQLKDYAAKSWAGLYQPFYYQRWQQFFDELEQSVRAGRNFNEGKVRADIAVWEQQWINSDVSEGNLPSELDPVFQIRALLHIVDLK